MIGRLPQGGAKNMEDKNMQATTKRFVMMAYAGQNHEAKPQTAKNKELFNKDKAMAHTIGHVIVHHGHDLNSIKTWAKKGFKSGLQENNASALCLSAWAMVQDLGFEELTKANAKTVQAAVFEAVQAYAEAIANDDDNEDLSEEDLLGDDNEDLSLDDLDDLGNDDDATVEADFVEYAEIEAAWGNPHPFINAARLAFMADDNLNNDGHHTFFIDGKTKSKRATVMVATSGKSVETVFMNKVATMGGMNLAGLATKRGSDWCSSTIFKGVRPKNINLNQKLRLRLGVAYCVVAVKAGVSRFNHDLRKYISDETIDALRNMVVEDGADMEHPAATTNGWFLPYQRGQVVSDRASYDDLMGDLSTLL